MQIFSVPQIRAWDQYTIQNEPVSSVDLMERASRVFVKHFQKYYSFQHPVYIVCGTGNNGGDGLAIARLLHQLHYKVRVFILNQGANKSADFSVNYQRLKEMMLPLELMSVQDFPELGKQDLIIDALFGSGLSRPLEGLAEDIVKAMNESPATVVSVDIPSGMFADQSSGQNSSVQAERCFTFQSPKLGFLLAENQDRIQAFEVCEIGLHPDFAKATSSPYVLSEEGDILQLLKNRSRFSHKGTYGHALLISGSYGMMGAAILSARACLKVGVGLLTVHIPQAGYEILQTSLPEAMVSPDSNRQFITQVPATPDRPYAAIGIGPGMGRQRLTGFMLDRFLDGVFSPLVLDADAINLIAESDVLKEKIPPKSILTPHPGEFKRLVRASDHDFEQIDLLQSFCQAYEVYVVLKGAFSAIGTPEGKVYFNTTGNPGMATAGSGDVLTGMICGLLAQNYSPESAARLGVYLHGLAGDLAAADMGKDSLIAGDLVNYIPKAFQALPKVN